MGQTDPKVVEKKVDDDLANWEELRLIVPIDLIVKMLREMREDFPSALSLYVLYYIIGKRLKRRRDEDAYTLCHGYLGWDREKYERIEGLLIKLNYLQIEEVGEEESNG